MTKAKHIAVLMGGWSVERTVSLASGAACARALKNLGHKVTEIDVQRDPGALISALKPAPDVVFNALHGRGGEDGCIQGILDIMGLPYTHSGRLASALAMNKHKAKQLVAHAGIRIPYGKLHQIKKAATTPLMDPPYVIKPNDEGSSMGVYIVRPGDKHLPVTREDWPYGETCLVEQYIPGQELSVAVMGEGESAQALTVTEIVPRGGFYDYDAKYEDGGSAHLLPANIDQEVFKAACQAAVTAHQALSCRGITRSDFRFDNSQEGTNGLYYLETNTQPGMTPTSLVPEQAAHTGMDFETLVNWMVEHAACD